MTPERPGASTEAMLALVQRDGESDEVAVELPLEIRLNGEPVAVTMRTPGDDEALAAGDLLEIHPEDAAPRGLDDGGIATIRSRRGEIKLPVQVTTGIEPGHVFTTFHFPEARTNLLVGSSSDVNTSCPEYKVIAVAVEQHGAAGKRGGDSERELAMDAT